MNNIPNISFQSEVNKTDFDFINLSKLFARFDAIKDHNPSLPNRISFFALLIVTKGTGKHQIDLKDYKLKEGTVLKIAKGQVHAFQKNPKYEGFLIVFTEDFVMNYFSKSTTKLIAHLYNYHLATPLNNDKAANQDFLKQVKQELKSTDTYARINILAVMLELYLLRIERNSRIDKSPHNSKQYITFIEFKNLVESKYTTTRNVKDYASQLFISTKTLNQVVKEFTFNTAKFFIDQYVILEAKRAIVSTNYSFKEIAFDLGFDEVTNFTKFFKKKMNTTPKDFRVQHIS